MTKSKVDVKALEQVENNFKEITAPGFFEDVENIVDAIQSMYSHCVNLTTMGYISTSFLYLFAQRIKQLNSLESKSLLYIDNGEFGRAEQYLDIVSNSIELKIFENAWTRLAKNHDDFVKLIAMQNNNPDAILEMLPTAEEVLHNCLNSSIKSNEKRAKDLKEQLNFVRKAII
jgi:hypothetical protein